MAHKVEIAPAAARDLRSLPPQARDRLEPVILSLSEDCRPHGVRKIEGEDRAYRVRVGPYRILYEIYDAERLVVVLRVRRRNEGTYRDR